MIIEGYIRIIYMVKYIYYNNSYSLKSFAVETCAHHLASTYNIMFVLSAMRNLYFAQHTLDNFRK